MSWKEFRLNKRLSLSQDELERIYFLIARIEGVKNSWSLTAQFLPQTIEKLTQSLLVTSTGASNRIEGNKLTDDEVESLYKNVHVKKFKTRDEQEVVGYLEMLEKIINYYHEMPLTENLILQLHHEMLAYSEKDSHHKGVYKISPNRVEAKDNQGHVVGIIFEPTAPFLVQKEIQELIEWYHWALNAQEKHPLIIVANFIFEYLAIHPFQDGNGRTSRLLTNLLLLQQGYDFVSLVSHEKIIELLKVDYYKALNKTQATWKTEKESVEPWILFFLTVVTQQADNALELLKEDSIESLLSEKQCALWLWAQGTEEKIFSRKDAIQNLQFPARTVEGIIKKLLEMKRLKKLGQGSGTRYKVVKK